MENVSNLGRVKARFLYHNRNKDLAARLNIPNVHCSSKYLLGVIKQRNILFFYIKYMFD